MKKYEIVAAQEVVAEFRMNYNVFVAKFGYSTKLIEWIKEEHPELQDCSYLKDFTSEDIVIQFCSSGNPVIQEVQ